MVGASLDFEKGRPTPVKAISDSEFSVEGASMRIAFTRNQVGEVIGAVLNPGALADRRR